MVDDSRSSKRLNVIRRSALNRNVDESVCLRRAAKTFISWRKSNVAHVMRSQFRLPVIRNLRSQIQCRATANDCARISVRV